VKNLKVIDANYPIHPEHINTDEHFFNAFDEYMTEVSANWVVRFCQEKGGWFSFTEQEINLFYNRDKNFGKFDFNQLCSKEFILKEGDEFFITHRFIVSCFLSSPSEAKEELFQL
jgi:hypothetical protein